MSLGDLLDRVEPLLVSDRGVQVVGLVIEGYGVACRARGQYGAE